jgi:hypothetical protein
LPCCLKCRTIHFLLWRHMVALVWRCNVDDISPLIFFLFSPRNSCWSCKILLLPPNLLRFQIWSLFFFLIFVLGPFVKFCLFFWIILLNRFSFQFHLSITFFVKLFCSFPLIYFSFKFLLLFFQLSFCKLNFLFNFTINLKKFSCPLVYFLFPCWSLFF